MDLILGPLRLWQGKEWEGSVFELAKDWNKLKEIVDRAMRKEGRGEWDR